MQATTNLPQTAPNGQPTTGKYSPLLPLPDLAHLKQQHKNRIIEDWLNASDEALAALLIWRGYLKEWQAHSGVTDGAFMGVVQDMAEAGLDEWLNASWADIDALRSVVVTNDR
jgi:hypothetical protein